MTRKLTAGECGDAMRDGEFPAELRRIAPRVAIILTQSWCPQWLMMRSWLEEAASREDTAILWVEYDDEPFFEPFMRFKEDVLGNRLIPYVRYYRDGQLVRTSNYLDRKSFTGILHGPDVA